MGFLKGHNTTIRENQISDFTVSTAQYGASVCEILGTTRISPNVIYWDDFTAHEHKSSQRAGKGGRSKTTTITYTYTVAVILALCEGQIAGIGKMWKGKNVYQYPNGDVGLTLFSGTPDQKPWAYVQGKHPNKALAYENLAYMAGVIDLGDSGSMPTFNFEVKGKLLDTGDGVDVNPADYILYILSKIGLSSLQIDGIDNYRKYCKEADMLISTPSDDTDAKAARDIINDIATITNAYIFWSNDKLKIVPRADRSVGSWTPDKTIRYNLGPDDFIPQDGGVCISYARKESSEVYNRISVEFLNRSNGYEKEIVNYQDNDDIKEHGVRQASTVSAHYLYTKTRAVKLAEELCRKNKYERVKYTFKLDWAFCRLEPGDLVMLNDPAMGIEDQPAMIDSVTEGTDGVLTFTAISRAKGVYDEAEYDVHNVDRPYIDYNAEAPDTDTPLIIQPPAELTSNGLELWIGAKGKGNLWGGCDVYVSDNNTNYRSAGQIIKTSRIGILAADCTVSDTTLTITSNGDFLSGTKQDAERGNTLCWVDGECFSYETATLLADGSWQLSGCVRGQYNTAAAAHKAGTQFARLDNALLKIDFLPADIGKTIWLKFASFNIFGTGNQDLSQVKAYEYNLQKYYIPPVTNLHLYNRYREQSDGVSRYDIVVQWDKPNWPSYLEGQAWFKTSGDMAENLSVKEGVPAEEMGFSGPWQYAGSGENCVIIPQAVVGDTYKVCVVTKDIWGMTSSRDLAPSKSLLVAMKTTIPNVPDGLNITFGKAAVLSWKEVTNADVACYEIRTDKNPGAETPGMLMQTSSLSAAVGLANRQGKIYLYAKSAQGKYSEPAVLAYNKPLPPKPDAPVVSPKLGGMAIATEAIPSDCLMVNVYIDAGGGESKSLRSEKNLLSYLCGAGVYDVSVAFIDMFGEGPRSGATTCTVKVEIDQSMIKDGVISLDKVDKELKQVFNTTIPNMHEGIEQITNTTIPNMQKGITQNSDSIQTLNTTTIPNMQEGITQNSDSITALVKDGKGYASAIAQNSNSINTLVKDGKGYASAIAQNSASITALVKDGKGYASAITQNSDSINTLVQDGKGYASSIAQNTDSINTLVQDGRGYSSAIAQNSTSINSVVTNLNAKDGYKNYTALSQLSDSISALVKDGKGYASSIAQNSASITAMVTNLNTKDGYKNYTALSQLGDAINLRVEKDDVINQINLTSETTTIDGKHLHVTGDTFFDKNVVASGMIQAGAVTADKLSVDSLSAITATIGTLRTKTNGARTEIHDNLIEVYDENNVLRVRMGVWDE